MKPTYRLCLCVDGSRVGWKFELEIDVDGEIHPEDATTAILTRIFASYKGSTSNLKRSVDAIFLDSVANNWTSEQGKCYVPLLSEDKDFRERFGRACAKGRQPTFDKIDKLILRNWRAIHDINEITHMPGLRHWHPRAAALLFTQHDENLSGSQEWFEQRCKRLSLEAVRPYRVQNFRQNRDDKFMVDLD